MVDWCCKVSYNAKTYKILNLFQQKKKILNVLVGMWKTLNKAKGPYYKQKYFLLFLFFFGAPRLLPSIFFEENMDDAQHFGAAHYRLWVLLFAFWAYDSCKVSITCPKCAQKDPKSIMGSTNMCVGIPRHILDRKMGSRGEEKKRGSTGLNTWNHPSIYYASIQ